MSQIMGSCLPGTCPLGSADVGLPGVDQKDISLGLSGLDEVLLSEGREMSPFRSPDMSNSVTFLSLLRVGAPACFFLAHFHSVFINPTTREIVARIADSFEGRKCFQMFFNSYY